MALSERTKEILKSGYDYQGLALDMYEDKCDNCIELQKRIDKAIEKLEDSWMDYDGNLVDKNYKSFEIEDIIDILRGEDNE